MSKKKLEFTSELLRNLDIKKLVEESSVLKKELFNLRFQKILGDFANTSRFKKVKKGIARINTELNVRKKSGESLNA